LHTEARNRHKNITQVNQFLISSREKRTSWKVPVAANCASRYQLNQRYYGELLLPNIRVGGAAG